ncbi:SDR family oxidoreductase [Rhodanobacter aciditrophus]|uniref:SDR family oxidoreductase n=1 Tax=Rhodanobacter aciditrophus TaxID=1623218 RepID=A0ABW4B5H5_9GAMM
MKYIIHGATGAQGKPLFDQLIHKGKNALAAVRHLDSINASQGVEVDLASIESLVAAYSGADGIFVHLPLGPESARQTYANNIAEAIERAEPGRVVISTSGWKLGVEGDTSALPTLIEKVTATGVPTAVIAPQLYLENLLLPIVMEPVRKEGVLPYPLREDYPVSWCSHLDIADVTAHLLQDSTVIGIVEVGMLPAITGTELATAFSEHFGKTVRFDALSPAEFGDRLATLFGRAAADEVVSGYEAKAQTSDSAIHYETSAQSKIGLRPRSVAKWLADIA